MTESGGIAIIGHTNAMINGHQQDITIVAAAGAAEVRMREAIDDIITGMVSGAAIPTAQARIRTKLYHTERHGCTGVCMSMTAGTNFRINKGSEVNLCEAACR